MKRYAIAAVILCAALALAQLPKPGGAGPSASTASVGGDLTGTVASATVAKIQGRTVVSTAPEDGQLITWDAANSRWAPASITTTSVKPGNVKVTSTSVLTINDGCSAGSPCYVGQSEFTGSATATITGGSGSGSAKVYKCGATVSTHCPTANVIIVSHPSAASLTINCVGCTQIQKSTPTVPTGAVPLYSATITNGAWTAVTDQRVFVSEGVGSTVTQYIAYKAAVCQNATASLGFSTPTSNPAVAACVTGSNTQYGVAQFANSGSLSVQDHIYLPPDWTGSIDAKIKWRTSATSGSVVWQLALICIADAETGDPAFNTASTVTDAAKGTTLQWNDAEIAGVTATGCAAGEQAMLKFLRDSAHASDDLAATADLISLIIVLQRESN